MRKYRIRYSVHPPDGSIAITHRVTLKANSDKHILEQLEERVRTKHPGYELLGWDVVYCGPTDPTEV